MKKYLLIAALCLTLTGCSVPSEPVPSPTLPPVIDDVAAPVGDAALTYTADAALYLPSRDGRRLICVTEPVELNRGRHPAEAVVRALLSHAGNQETAPLGGTVPLRLAADDPVELTGEVCTVKLTPSALLLDRDDLYTVCLGLAATLGELPDIRAVNVLVAGQAIAMDVADCLPLGSVAARPGEELPVLWSQMDARRVPVGVNPSTVPLTAAATLYFPLADGTGLLPEVRSLSFLGQTPLQLTQGLLEALSAGPAEASDAATPPNLGALMTRLPEVTDLEDGGRMLSLYFPGSWEAALRAANVDPACMAASLTCTLTTFIPSITCVSLYVGETLTTSVYNASLGSVIFPGGLMRRADFTPYLKTRTTFYLPRDGRLEAVGRSVADTDAYHPRALLLALMDGPTPAEAAEGFTPLLPAGLTDADILGLAVTDDTLLVNLSARFAQAIEASELDQHLMCRGLVAALCERMNVRRVRFFFHGESVGTLGGPIDWGGAFLYNPAMIPR